MPTVAESLVTIIVPVNNRPALLVEAVDSVLSQNYGALEVVIVDDGSTDGTGEVANRYKKKFVGLVEVIHQEKCGPGSARQAGLDIARGEFIQFLDSDDLLLPGKFEKQVKGLRENSECSISYGKTREYVIGETPKDVPARRTGEKWEELFPTALMGRLWATETPLYRRKALEEIGPWSGLKVLEDWEYECRLGARKAKLHYCDEFVSDHRHHPGAREGLRWQVDIEALKDMLTAHIKVLEYAQAAGVEENGPEMRHFARNIFRLAREAGKRGLKTDAKKLVGIAADIDPGNRREYLVYEKIARFVGWARAEQIGFIVKSRVRFERSR